MGNPPPPLAAKRVVVKAARPKVFIWEIIEEDLKGNILRIQESKLSFQTMEAAYIDGKAALQRLKS
jgi:hypothetical protein